MSILESIFGSNSERLVKSFSPIVSSINSLEEEYEKLDDEAIKQKTLDLKKRLVEGETEEGILPEAFALVREASKRTLGLRHFDVQLIGGIALFKGNIAEMRTGEGKTLVATLPLYLRALRGEGVHLVTVNDYLSRRDAVWMGQVFDFLGLTVGIINNDASYIYDPLHSSPKEEELDQKRDETASYKVVYEFLRPSSRKEAYSADITYGTNSEFGFDYLRDNIAKNPADLRQRGHHFAIIDEVDSILIDEARTPLIISAPSNRGENLYEQFSSIASKLQKEEDYTVDEKHRSISLTDHGIEKAEKILGIENIYTEGGVKYVHHLETAVRAKALFSRDKEYVVKDGEIIIVDESTGRMQPGRRWSEGLHQAIEAKEGVQIKEETRTYASVTYQNYFRLFKGLSGMTGTAETSKEEFMKVYGLDTIVIPTNKKIERIDRNDQIFRTEIGKFKAIARKVKEVYEKGQPVLVGTVSIEKNEMLSQFLTKSGVPHELLNAKNHEKEGEIIAGAGKKKAVTIATNMAGRGVDIKLGGLPYSEEKAEEIRKLGGLFVLGTERHEARRIDNQLRGRSGRQGDPGETQFFVSLEDDLMRIFASDLIKNMMARLNVPEDEPIENKFITRSIETAQTRIEGYHFDSRKHVLEYDNVLNHQRKSIYEKRRKVLVGSKEEVEELLQSFILGDENLEKVLVEKRQSVGEDQFILALRHLILDTIDMFWMEHLETMDYLRSSVNLRSYGQRDPLVEYKKDGLRLFKEMEVSIAESVRNSLVQVTPAQVYDDSSPEIVKSIDVSVENPSNSTNSHEKIGRNDPCFCGSGEKYKKCHGKNS